MNDPRKDRLVDARIRNQSAQADFYQNLTTLTRLLTKLLLRELDEKRKAMKSDEILKSYAKSLTGKRASR